MPGIVICDVTTLVFYIEWDVFLGCFKFSEVVPLYIFNLLDGVSVFFCWETLVCIFHFVNHALKSIFHIVSWRFSSFSLTEIGFKGVSNAVTGNEVHILLHFIGFLVFSV